MAFIDKKNPVVLNIKLTSKGRELLSKGNLRFKYFAIGDSEIDYNFNAETGHLSVNSNILRPLDNNPNILSFITKSVSGNPYNAIPSMGSQYLVTNTTEPNGFFTNVTGNTFTFITDGNHVKQPDIMIYMSGITGGISLRLRKSLTYGTSGTEPTSGDTILIKWTLNGDTTSYITNKTEPTPFLVYQITNVISGTLAADNLVVTIDRELPDFSAYSPTGTAGALVYKPIIDFSGDTLFNFSSDYLDESVLTFLQNSQCPTVIFPFWNMSIIFTEDIAGIQTGNKTYGDFKTKNYAGFVSYIQNQVPYYKKLGVIHYTNSSPANVYAEGFYLQTPKLIIPTIMWHKSTGTTLGATFVAGGGYILDGLNAHYYELVDSTDPTVVVGKIFDELKLFVIEDPELLFAMSYKSNRSWTLPKPIAAAGGGCVEEVPTLSIKTSEGTAGQGQILGTGGYDITDVGNVTEYGMQYKLSSATNWSDLVIGTGVPPYNTFNAIIGGLSGNVSYSYRAYVKSGSDLYTGEILTIITLTVPPTPVVPTVSIGTVSEIAQTTATVSGNVNADGGATITARGMVWSTLPSPTIANSKTINVGTIGAYTSSLTGLIAGSLYYVKAYATNSAGTAYSSELTFTTLAPTTTPPTITTVGITSIGQTTATGGGNVTNEGTASVTAKGIVWSISSSPTISSHLGITSDGTGLGSFTSSLTGLVAGTLYYVRAYATSTAGTSYGNEVSFTTTAAAVAPTITTSSITSIAETTATGGGNVTSDGGSVITARGVVWSTSSGPTLANNHSEAVGTTGTYSVSLSGLASGTLYYVRAYATNGIGTSYGTQVSFTTLIPLTIFAQACTDVLNFCIGGVYRLVCCTGSISQTRVIGSPMYTIDSTTWNNVPAGCYYVDYSAVQLYCNHVQQSINGVNWSDNTHPSVGNECCTCCFSTNNSVYGCIY